MAGNPLIPQGVLNRLRGSANIIDSPELNVTAPYLGKAGIAFTLEGQATGQIGTMTGIVNSPEVYLMASLVINILKTQSLGAIYKARWELNSQLGDIVVTPDASPIGTFYLNNASIESVAPMTFNGEDAGMGITIKGYYLVNSSLWNLEA